MIPIVWIPDTNEEHDHEAWVGNYRMQVKQCTTKFRLHVDLVWPDNHITPIQSGELLTDFVDYAQLSKFALAAMEQCENILYKTLLSAPVRIDDKGNYGRT